MRKVSDIFITKLETHNSISINIFQKIVMFMRLCTIISYDQTGQRYRYGPCAILAVQRKAVIKHLEYVIFIYFHCKNVSSNATTYYVKRRIP